MNDLLTRLKERKLVQWALAYVAGAWVVLQVADTLGDNFEWPRLVFQSLAVLLAVGLLAALVLAWYHGERGRQRVTGPELLMLAGILVIAGAAVAFVRGSERPPAAAPAGESPRAARLAAVPTDAAERSIAVLPFENLSSDPENAYFSDGITEDVLMNLSRIGDLKVISRTSVMSYKGTSKQVRQIGEELGVTHVLEGSVRRSGDRVKITAQLIDARTDEHLWAQDYDRELTAESLFEIQAEIARQIAGALQVHLSGEGRAQLAGATTGSLRAYDLYLQAREYSRRPRRQDNEIAIRLFKQAVELDPTYAPAYAGLASAYTSHIARWTPARFDSAAAASRKSIELAPELADGYTALGKVFWRLGRVRDMREQFQKAIRINPNHPEAVAGMAWSSFELGRMDEAHLWFKRALALEPTNAFRYRQVGLTYRMLGDHTQAEQWFRRGLQVQPDNSWLYGDLAELSIQRREWMRAAAQIDTTLALAPENEIGYVRAGELALGRGDRATALRHFRRAAVLGQVPARIEEGYVHWAAGDRERAQAIFRDWERRYRERIRKGDERNGAYYGIARIHAARGDADEALERLQAAIEHGLRGYDRVLNDPLLRTLRNDSRFRRMITDASVEVERQRQRIEREGG